tara:strand:- start:3060 stop:5138 length:2079 start_codon:yes stop_codon:yes gene_type:complete
MKGELFAHEVTQTSAIFGRKKDVNVVMQGDSAYTDGKTIVVPSIDYEKEISDENMAIIRGFTDHEAGHVRHTDFNSLKLIDSGNKLQKECHNALEDIWLERRVIDEYPGAAKNIQATATKVNQMFLDNVDIDDPRVKKDTFMGPAAITWEGRKDYGGDTIPKLMEYVDDELTNAVRSWIKALDACENSMDVLALAKEVERQLRTEEYRDEPEIPQETEEADEDEDQRDVNTSRTTDGGGHATEDTSTEGEGSTSMEDGDDCAGEDGSEPSQSGGDGDDEEEDGMGKSDGDDEEDDQAKGDEEGGEQEGDGASGGSSAEDGDGGGDKVEDDSSHGHGAVDVEDKDALQEVEVYDKFRLSDGVEEALKEINEGSASRGSYIPFAPAHDKWHHKDDKPGKYGRQSLGRLMNVATNKKYTKRLESTAGSTNSMRRKLERALMAKQQRDWDYGREVGKLDSRRLASAYNGMPNVFKMRDDRAEMDTALTMLIDLSGSMNGVPAWTAELCAIAMSEAIDKTGIAYEVLGFNNASRWNPKIPYPKGNWKGCSRVSPIDMYIFKAFEERLVDCRKSMASISALADGDNSDGEALGYAYDRLKRRQEKRRVMIVMSDGVPASASYGGMSLSEHLRRTVKRIAKDGTDIIGIGIMSNAVERFYDKYVVVNSLDDLASGGMDMLSKALLGDKFVVDNSKLIRV